MKYTKRTPTQKKIEERKKIKNPQNPKTEGNPSTLTRTSPQNPENNTPQALARVEPKPLIS
jgi:hypothetical protein